MNLQRILLFIFLITSSKLTLGAGKLEMSCKVKDEMGNQLKNSWAIVYLDGQRVDYVAANSEGKIEFKLEVDKIYTVEVEDKNHDQIVMKIDSKLPAEMKKYTYSYIVNLNLVKKKEGYKVRYIGDPVMYIGYLKNKDAFGMTKVYDATYDYEPLPVAQEIKKDPPTKVEPIKNEVVKNEIPKEKEKEQTPLVKSTPPKETKQKDIIDEQARRTNEAKKSIGQLEKEKAVELNKETKDMLRKASFRRTFMEELADSKRTMKQKADGYIPSR